jgi:hypothetical protein
MNNRIQQKRTSIVQGHGKRQIAFTFVKFQIRYKTLFCLHVILPLGFGKSWVNAETKRRETHVNANVGFTVQRKSITVLLSAKNFGKSNRMFAGGEPPR